ncbi:MAG: phosphotransferase [Armatimonadetes bacterium]|nr:phosphotransferase [Armatimonadota bacterium]
MGEIRGREEESYALWEYLESLRPATEEDLVTAAVEAWTLTSACDFRPVQPDSEIESPFTLLGYIAHNLWEIDIEKVQGLIPRQARDLLEISLRWADYFLSPGFRARYAALPRGFVHGDVHRDNIIVTAGGLKLIDWDNARIDARLAELTKPMLCLVEAQRYFERIDRILTAVRRSAHPLNEDEERIWPQVLLMQYVAADIFGFFLMRTRSYSDDRIRRRFANSRYLMRPFVDEYGLHSPPK